MMCRTTVVLAAFIAPRTTVAARATPEPPTEASAGFDRPTLVQNPGSKSSRSGIGEPPGGTFALHPRIDETQHDVNTGLGPVYNGRVCAEFHQNPVSGGASPFTELPVGHRDENGNFVNPTVLINDGAASIAGRSIWNDRAVVPQAQEHVPITENIRALRAAFNTLGDGVVEAIEDGWILDIAATWAEMNGGRTHGEATEGPIFEAPGQTRIGRFGRRGQHGSLLSFVADACLNEMGVAGRLRPKDTTSIGKVTQDPKDTPASLGLADMDHFTQFFRDIRCTKTPPRDAVLAATEPTLAGEQLIHRTGCSTGHVAAMTTASAGTVIEGGQFVVPEAFGNKIIHSYCDFLRHGIETGVGIVESGPQDTADKLRPAPLWGLRMFHRFTHDLRSLPQENAIGRHQGEAEPVLRALQHLSEEQQTAAHWRSRKSPTRVSGQYRSTDSARRVNFPAFRQFTHGRAEFVKLARWEGCRRHGAPVFAATIALPHRHFLS